MPASVPRESTGWGGCSVRSQKLRWPWMWVGDHKAPAVYRGISPLSVGAQSPGTTDVPLRLWMGCRPDHSGLSPEL